LMLIDSAIKKWSSVFRLFNSNNISK
jgi:hypothetical protein